MPPSNPPPPWPPQWSMPLQLSATHSLTRPTRTSTKLLLPLPSRAALQRLFPSQSQPPTLSLHFSGRSLTLPRRSKRLVLVETQWAELQGLHDLSYVSHNGCPCASIRVDVYPPGPQECCNMI